MNWYNVPSTAKIFNKGVGVGGGGGGANGHGRRGRYYQKDNSSWTSGDTSQ